MSNIKWIASEFFSENKFANQMIIIHHTGSYNGKIYSLRSTIDWFRPNIPRKTKKVSAHYIIPREEQDIIQMVKDEHAAWHAGLSKWIDEESGEEYTNLNNRSIGIELQGDGNLAPYTDFQYRALIELLREKMDQFSIPIKFILGHEDVSPGRKVDPGYYFDWDMVRQELEKNNEHELSELIEESEPEEIEEREDITMSGGLVWWQTILSLLGFKV